MQNSLNSPAIQKLFEAICCINTSEECQQFFEDIGTINELLSFAQRLEVAQMLHDNKTYTEISQKTGASTATISRVKRALHYGTGGYKLILERQKEKTKEP